MSFKVLYPNAHGTDWNKYIIYDVEEPFGSMRGLYKKASKVDVGITLDVASTWMRAQPNKQTRNLISIHRSVSEPLRITLWLHPSGPVHKIQMVVFFFTVPSV